MLAVKPSLGRIASGLHRRHPRYRGCVGHWMMTEGGGEILYDASGYGRHGRFFNGPTWQSGNRGPVVDCSGADDYVAINPIGELSLSPYATIVGWMYRQSTSVGVNFGAFSDPKRFSVLWFTDGKVYFSVDTGTGASYTRYPLSGTGWHFVAGRFDGTQDSAIRSELYWDGLWVAKDQTVGSQPAKLPIQVEFRIGMDFNSGLDRDFDGRYDEIRVYNRALLASEILSLYQNPFLEFEQRRRYFFVQQEGINLVPRLMAQKYAVRRRAA